MKLFKLVQILVALALAALVLFGIIYLGDYLTPAAWIIVGPFFFLAGSLIIEVVMLFKNARAQ